MIFDDAAEDELHFALAQSRKLQQATKAAKNDLNITSADKVDPLFKIFLNF